MPHRGSTANQIDSWIPPHIIQYCYENSPSQMLPRGGRRVAMLVIGKCLKDQYDALASPVPPQRLLLGGSNPRLCEWGFSLLFAR
jgi:hypothetical protein